MIRAGSDQGFSWATAPKSVQGWRNQDSFFCLKSAAGVFDGVGAAADSDKASRWVADYIRDRLSEVGLKRNPSEMAELLQNAMQDADRYLKALCKAGRLSVDAGTTAVTAVVLPPEKPSCPIRDAVVCWAGDSRCYAFLPGGELHPITIDGEVGTILHGWAVVKLRLLRTHQQFLAEVSAKEQLDTDQKRRLFLTKSFLDTALWADPKSPTQQYAVSIVQVPIGSKLLITSDGVHDNLRDSELAHVLKMTGRGAKAIVRAARSRASENHLRSKNDDQTVVVATVS